MRYDQPLQIKDGPHAGKWHFVRKYGSDGRRGMGAIGYCAEGCNGHDTAEEAREHYRQYLLDQRLRFFEGPDDPSTLRKCQVEGCTAYTAGRGQLGEWLMWNLCATHRTREVVEVLYPVANDSFGS